MDVATLVFGAVAALKNLRDLTASLGKSVPEEVRAQVVALYDKISEVQGAVLAAQQREAEVTKRCRDLEDQLGLMNDWQKEKARYTLQNIDDLAFVYGPRPMAAFATLMAAFATVMSDDPHWLCANCFEEGKKSHLQAEELTGNGTLRPWTCPRCHTSVLVRSRTKPGLGRSILS